MKKLNMSAFLCTIAAVVLLLPIIAAASPASGRYRAGTDLIPFTTAGSMDPVINDAFAMNGTAEALLLSCMDFRLIEHVGEFMQHDLGLTDEYDYVVLAGASLGVNNATYPEWGKTFWNHVDLSIQLHKIKKVIVVDHRNCGAYRLLLNKDYPADSKAPALAEETAAHKEQMDKLAAAIHAKYPDLTIETYLMSLDGKTEHIGEITGVEKAAAAAAGPTKH